jgi:hypothetical protein
MTAMIQGMEGEVLGIFCFLEVEYFLFEILETKVFRISEFFIYIFKIYY